MITKKKGKILDRWTAVVVECPYCEFDNCRTINDYINRDIVDVWCDECEEVFKVSMFECLDQSN
jgi:hypothetical protein